MSKIVWDQDGQRTYETGADHAVLYPKAEGGTYPKGVPWNGLINVEESPSGGEATAMYADNIKYGEVMSAEDFGATVEAYTYPKEFEECDGSKEIAPGVYAGQQTRKPFGMSYRTLIGNDIAGEEYGYKLHLVYGAKAKPASKSRQTINESVEAATLSWELTTTPVNVTGGKPTAHLVIDSTVVDAEKMAAIEAILYGSESEEARLPLPDEVAELLKATI